MKPTEEVDEFELQLRRERAEKRRRTVRIIAILATIFLIGSSSFVYFSGLYQGAALDPHPCDPAEVEALASDGFTLEKVAVDGAELAGLVRRPREPDGPWVLFFGGSLDHLLRTSRAYLQLLLGRDDRFGAASFAYRGYDTSTGETKPSLLQADARAVFDYLAAKHDVRASRLHVIGYSLGANAAALLGAQLAKTEYTLASTSLLAPGIAPHRLPPWLFPLVIGAFEMPSKLKAMRGPVLIVSASDDPAYPPDIHARKMPAFLGDRLVQHLEVTGGHDGPLRDEGSLAAVRALVGVGQGIEAVKPTGRQK